MARAWAHVDPGYLEQSAPIRIGSGVSSIPNSRPYTVAHPSGQRNHVRRGGVAAVGQRQRMLGGQPGGRAVARIALAEAGALDQPARGQLHPVRAPGSWAPARRRAPASRSNSGGRDDRVGEERPDAPGVVVGLVEHHALACPQRQHRVAHPRPGRRARPARRPARRSVRRSAAARCGPSASSANSTSSTIGGVGVLENACAVTESEVVAADPAVLAGGDGRAAGPGGWCRRPRRRTRRRSAPASRPPSRGCPTGTPARRGRAPSAVTTTSSHTAPASARTMLPSTVISALASSTTVRSARSSASTTLDPPASTSVVAGSPSQRAQRRRRPARWSSQVISRRATGPTRSVVSGASGTSLGDGTRPPISELTTGGNGSLASYAAFIRHGRRIRGQRRTGPPGIQR